jgi:hypothetical protein
MSKLELKMRSIRVGWSLIAVMATILLLAAAPAFAAIPGVNGPTFTLTASADYITMPDGASVYSWGYGVGSMMQLPGPTLIVHQGDTVTLTLWNHLPIGAGNTSIVFPGQQVSTTGGTAGLVTQEAAPNGSVTYTFVAGQPGTYSYYSGTKADLQIEMGLYGALIVYPTAVPAGCTKAAYNHPGTCYDREYLFLLSEIDLDVHRAVEAQVAANTTINVPTVPYWPEYWMINGRSAPDTMSRTNWAILPHQPYNSFPRMHPGEKLLLRVIGAGHQMHPFHIHGNHARELAKDGRLLVSATNPSILAGPLLFTIPAVPGGTSDSVYEWTGKELGWDVYGHTNPLDGKCTPDASGYNTAAGPNYREWCADHGKPIPVKLPDPTLFTNGNLYSGSPYMGVLAQLQPGDGGFNPNAGFTFMWHSHNEREIVNNDVFPGGLMTMLIVEPPVEAGQPDNIDETY